MPKQTKVTEPTPPQPPPSYPVTILVHTVHTGIIAQTICPVCKRPVNVSQYGRTPGQVCGCGYEWKLEITARPVIGPSEVKG